MRPLSYWRHFCAILVFVALFGWSANAAESTLSAAGGDLSASAALSGSNKQIACYSVGSAGSRNIFCNAVTSSGATGSAVQVNTGSGDNYAPVVTQLTNGDIAVVWIAAVSSTYALKGRLLQSSATAPYLTTLITEVSLVPAAADSIDVAYIAPLQDGSHGVGLVYVNKGVNLYYNVMSSCLTSPNIAADVGVTGSSITDLGLTINAAGKWIVAFHQIEIKYVVGTQTGGTTVSWVDKDSPTVLSTTYSASCSWPVAASFHDGFSLICYQCDVAGDGTAYGIICQDVDEAGALVGVERAIASTDDASGFNAYPTVGALANGGYAITWVAGSGCAAYLTSVCTGDIKVALYKSTDAQYGSTQTVSVSNSGANTYPFVVGNSDNEAFVTWTSSNAVIADSVTASDDQIVKITSPVTGSFFVGSSVSVTISGAAPSCAALSLYLDGSTTPLAVTPFIGAWSQAVSVTAGSAHYIRVVCDASSSWAQPILFYVYASLTGPTITTPNADSFQSSTSVSISGSAPLPHATVVLASSAIATAYASVTSGSCGATANLFSASFTLPEGPNTVTAYALDGAGERTAVGTTRVVTVDSVAPVAPTVTSPVANAVVRRIGSTVTIALQGTTELNGKIVVNVQGGATSTVATTNGAFNSASLSVTLPTATDGSYPLLVQSQDQAGNLSPATTVVIKADGTAPTLSAFTPISGSVVNNRPTFSGTASELGATITVQSTAGAQTAGNTLATTPTTVKASVVDGTFSFTLVNALNSGSVIVYVRATDAVGNTALTPISLSVDSTPPNAPVINSPASGSIITTTTPTISGTAEPSSTLVVKVNDNVVTVSPSTADSGGSFSFSLPEALAEGSNTVSITATDAVGNTGSAGSSTFTVDITPPAKATITSTTANNAVSNANSFDFSVDVKEAVASKTVLVDGSVVSTIFTLDSGNVYTFSLGSSVMTDGERHVAVRTTDAAGFSTTSDDYIINVDRTPPARPTLSSPTVESGGITNSNAIVFQTDVKESVASKTVYVNSVEVTGVVFTLVSGTTYSFTLTDAQVPEGNGQSVEVGTSDSAGNTIQSFAFTFDVDRTAPQAPTITSTTVASGATTGASSIKFSADLHESVASLQIFLNDGLIVPAGLFDGNVYAFTLTTGETPSGSYSLVVKSTDNADNTATSTAYTFTVDRSPPSTPTISSPSVTASLTNAEPVIVVVDAVEAVSSVELYNGFDLVLVVPTQSGFTYTYSLTLASGSYSFTAKTYDEVDNEATSSAFGFTVDHDAPSKPSISSPDVAAGDVINDSSIIVDIDAREVVAHVELYINDVLFTSSFSVSGDFHRATVTSDALVEGTINLKAMTYDAAGNAATSDLFTFTVDRTAPTKPTFTTASVAALATTSATTVSFSVDAHEAVSSVEVKVNTVLVSPTPAMSTSDNVYTFSLSGAELPEGAVDVVFITYDAAGNQATSDAYSFTTDRIAPARPTLSSSTVADGGITNAKSIVFTADLKEAVASQEVYVNGQLVTVSFSNAGTNAVSFTLSEAQTPEGSIGVIVKTYDAASNSDNSLAYTFTVKRSAPNQPTIASNDVAANAYTNDGTLTFVVDSKVAVSAVTLSVNSGAAISPVSSSGNFYTFDLTLGTDFVEGSVSLVATSVDDATNTASSLPYTFTVDVTDPAVPTITGPFAADTRSNAQSFAFSVDTHEAVSSLAISINSVPITPVLSQSGNVYSFTLTTSDLGASPDHIVVGATSTDAAGNTRNAVAFSFYVDYTAPDAAVLAPEGFTTYTKSASPSFTFVVNEDSLTFEVYVDGAKEASIVPASTGFRAFRVSLSGLVDGSHTIYVKSIDVATNPSDSNTVTFVVDTTIATPTLAVEVNGVAYVDSAYTKYTSASFVVDPQEAGCTLEINVNGMPLSAYNSVTHTTVTAGTGNTLTFTLNGMQDGFIAVNVKAIDLAGNFKSSSISFNVDTTLATPVLTSPTTFVGAYTAETEVDFAVDAGETDMTWTIVVDDTNSPVTVGYSGMGTLYGFTLGLAPGAHTVAVVGVDHAGNSKNSNTMSFTVDTSVATPTVTATAGGSALLDGALTKYTSATFTVDAHETHCTVEYMLNGGSASSAGVAPVSGDVEANTQFTFTLTGLSDILNGITVRVTDRVGNKATNSLSWTVDSFVATPTLTVTTALSSHGATSSTAVSFSVDASENGMSWEAYLNSATVSASFSMSATTAYTFTLSSLADADYSLYVVGTDAAGNTASSSPVTFKVDTTITAPTLTVTSALEGGLYTNLVTVDFHVVTYENYVALDVYVEDTKQTGVSIVSQGSNTYSFSLSNLPEGARSIHVVGTDDAANSQSSSAVSFTVDRTPPDVPVVTSSSVNANGYTNAVTVAFAVDANELISSWAVSVDGFPQPGVTVTHQAGTSYTFSLASLTEGPHYVVATATDSAANSRASAHFDLTVDRTDPTKPTIACSTVADHGITNAHSFDFTIDSHDAVAKVELYVYDELVDIVMSKTGDVYSFTLDNDVISEGAVGAYSIVYDLAGNSKASDTYTFTVDYEAPSDPVVLMPVDLSSTNVATLGVSGTADAGTIVTLYLDGSLVPTVSTMMATAGSTFSGILSTPLVAEKTYEVYVISTEASGNTAQSASIHFTFDKTAPETPVITTPVDGSSTNVATVTVAGTAESGNTIQVFLDGNLVSTVAPLVADAAGDFSGVLAANVDTEKTYELVAVASDAAGNTASSSPVEFTYDITAPETPVITSFDANPVQNDATPLVAGTAEAYSTITVYVSGSAVETLPSVVTATGAGTFSCTIKDDLVSEQEYEIYVVSTDAASNSATSESITFFLDSIPPVAPVFTQPLDNTNTMRRPTIAGLSEPDSTVYVSVDGSPLQSAVADEDGVFFFRSPVLTGGNHVLRAYAVDAAGNQGPNSDPVHIFVFSPPPTPELGNTINHKIFRSQHPALTGWSFPDTDVDLYNVPNLSTSGTLFGTDLTSVHANFSIVPSTPLTQGVYRAIAYAHDEELTSPRSSPALFGVLLDGSSQKCEWLVYSPSIDIDTAIIPPVTVFAAWLYKALPDVMSDLAYRDRVSDFMEEDFNDVGVLYLLCPEIELDSASSAGSRDLSPRVLCADGTWSADLSCLAPKKAPINYLYIAAAALLLVTVVASGAFFVRRRNQKAIADRMEDAVLTSVSVQ